MGAGRIIGAFIILLTVMVMACQTAPVSSQEIALFIKAFENRAECLNRRLALERWEYFTTGCSDSLVEFQTWWSELVADPDRLAQVKRFRDLASDETQRKKLDAIYRLCLRYAVETQPDVSSLADTLLQTAREFQPVFEGKNSSVAEIRRVLASSDDRVRRQDAYKALATVGDKLGEGMVRLFRLRHQAAVRLGYSSYFDLMLTSDGLTKTEYTDYIEQIAQSTGEPYRRALDSLAGIIGARQLQIWDLDFVLAGGVENGDGHFPRDSQLALAKATLLGIGFNIDGMPIYLDSAAAGVEGREAVLEVSVPEDVRVILNKNDGFESLSHLMAQLGQAIYAVHVDNPDYLRTLAPAPCFETAMSLVFEDLVGREEWLRRQAGIPEPDILTMAAAHNLRRLAEIRMMLVWHEFERELYSDPFADADLTFQKAFEKYMSFPVPSAFSFWATRVELIDRPVTVQNDLLAHGVVAQTYEYLERKYGSVVGNPHTREFLVQNYFRFGGSEDWRVLLSRGTGEDLNPDYILAYCGI